MPMKNKIDISKNLFFENPCFTYGLVDGPIWPDGCDHEPDSYVVSFEVVNHARRELDRYDLYVFNGNHFQEVCIRYGKEPNEYISPGSTGQFIKNSTHEPYSSAVRILLNYGVVRWDLKNPTLHKILDAEPEPCPWCGGRFLLDHVVHADSCPDNHGQLSSRGISYDEWKYGDRG